MAKKALVFLLAVILSSQADGARKKVKQQDVADEDGPPCGYRIIKRLENCCAFPDLISNDVFMSCHEELKDSSPDEEETEPDQDKVALRSKKAKTKKTGSKSRKTRAATYKVGWGGGRSMGTYRGGRKSNGQAMCIYECVLRNQSLVKSDGEIDVPKMEKQFLSGAPAAWQPIIKEALSTCTTQYSKVKQNSLPKPLTSPSGRSCRFGPALFMSCFRGHLAQNCERNSKLTIDATCADKLEFLKTCNPFKVRGSSGKGGRFWGAVETEETTPLPPELQREMQKQESAVVRPAASSGFAKSNPELKSMYNIFG